MRKGRKDNRGLTLIELLVAVTIVTIVIGIAFGFIIHTIKLYRKGNDESGVQNEAQLTMAQLESLVMNANLGIGLNPETAGKTELTGNELYLYYRDYEKETYTENAVTGDVEKTDATDDYEAIHIYVDTAKGLSFCTRKCTYGSTLDGSGNTVHKMNMTEDKEDPEVLTKFVKGASDFAVDLSNLLSKNEVTFTMKFQYQGRSYTSKNTIKLRNKAVGINKDEAGDYFKLLKDTSVKNTTTNLTLENTLDATLGSTAYVWAGEKCANPFTAKHTYSNGSVSSGQTIWALQTPVTGVSINRQTGMLDIAADVSGSFVVDAIAMNSINADKSGTGTYVKASATIFVKSASNPQLGSFATESGNSKIQKGKLTITGTNLQQSDAASMKAYLVEGETLTPDIGDAVIAADGSQVSFDITLHRPVGYKNKTFNLNVGCKIGSLNLVPENPIQITFTENSQGDEDVFESVYIIASDDSGNSLTATTGGNFVCNKSVRGDKGFAQMHVKYTNGNTDVVSTTEWNLVSDNPAVTVTKGANGFSLGYNVGDYDKTVDVTLSSNYTNPEGTLVAGPTFTLSFQKVSLSLKNVNTQTQKMFPITRGKTQKLSFDVKGIKTSSLCMIHENTGLSTHISGDLVSVSAAASMTSAKTVTFGLKDSSGNILDNVSADVRFYPGTANTYSYNGGSLSNSIYLPLATDISRFDSNVQVPEADEDPIGSQIFMADGESIVYWNRAEVTDGSNKGVDNKIHQYWAQYKGEMYYFDATARQWRLNKTNSN